MYFIYSKTGARELVNKANYQDLIKTNKWFDSPLEAEEFKESKELKANAKSKPKKTVE